MPDMMSTLAETIWAWLLAGNNASAAAVLLTVGGGALGVAVKVRRPKAPPPSAAPGGNQAMATDGGVAIGGDAHHATITTNVTHNHAPRWFLTIVGTALILLGVTAIVLPRLNSETANVGLTKEQISVIFADITDLSPASLAKAITAAAQYRTVSREALTSFFTILKQQQVPAEQLTAKLTSIALQYTEMVQRLAALEKAAGPDDRPVLADAKAAILKGDYDRAERLFVSLEDAQAAARATAQANTDDLARRQAATRAERARLSALRQDHRAAADHFLAAANLLPAQDTEDRGHYLTDSADALRRAGEERGDNDALRRAIARYREALPPQDRHPALWGRIQNNLGSALTSLGERESGTARLTQAVDAFRNALREHTQERVPLDWAMTQNNLGSALARLGERENGTGRLTEAVDAFQNALRERTQERVPLAWATTQNNLGIALRMLGERESGTGRLTEAVEAYRNALRERTQERVPLDWAMTQNNLGNALWRLGEREKGTARLTESVEAFQNALRERTQERVPLEWAMTQTNMGNALELLAERNRDVDSARQAVAAKEAALAVFRAAGADYYIKVATNNLAAARATLAKLEGDADDSPPHQ